MRLLAMLGERDGHSGIHPFARSNYGACTAYPLRLYRFPEGLFVAQAEDRALVGARVAAIGGVPPRRWRRVRPLITRDNDWTVLDRIPNFVVCAEVLRGLGIAPTFTFELRRRPRGATFERSRTRRSTSLFGGWWEPQRGRAALPATAERPVRDLRDRPRPRPVRRLQRDDRPGLVPRKLIRMSRNRRVRRIVIDIRLNGGGNNTTYWG